MESLLIYNVIYNEYAIAMISKINGSVELRNSRGNAILGTIDKKIIFFKNNFRTVLSVPINFNKRFN